MVAHYVRDVGVAGSSPVIPTAKASVLAGAFLYQARIFVQTHIKTTASMKSALIISTLVLSLGVSAQDAPKVHIEKRVMVVKDGQKMEGSADSVLRHYRIELDSLPGTNAMTWHSGTGDDHVLFRFKDISGDAKPRLGVQITKIDGVQGLTVQAVEPVSTAAAIGLNVGDVIAAVNGQAVREPKALVDLIQGLHVGDEVVIEFRRDGAKKKVQGYLIPSGTLGLPQMPDGPLRIRIDRDTETREFYSKPGCARLF